MQTKSLLTSTILVCCFFISPVYSQSKENKDVDSLTGTWAGMVVRATSTGAVISTSFETWRIHNVDRNKSQIQMTESSFRMKGTDSARIERPRMTYSFKIEDKFLILPIKDTETDITFTLKLLLEKQEGVYTLQGEAGKLPPKQEKLFYGLGKFDNDTTNVIPKFIPTPAGAPKQQ